jgi:GAF domain-containing protein
LEQQTATAEVLGVINASPGDLAPVFDAILNKGVALCEAAFGTLFTYDGEQFRAVALRNAPEGLAELVKQPFPPLGPSSTTGRLVAGENVIVFADLVAQPAYAPGTTAHRLAEASGARSVLTVALRKEGVLHGAIAIYHREVRPFSDKQIALLENFGDRD